MISFQMQYTNDGTIGAVRNLEMFVNNAINNLNEMLVFVITPSNR